MQKPKIAILATYLGIINRGAETFVIELAEQLKQDYDITIFTTGEFVQPGVTSIRIDVKEPWLLKKYSAIFNYLSVQNSLYVSTTALHKKLWRLFCKVVFKVKSFSPYFFPQTMYQYSFTKKAFDGYINDGNFSLIFPNNGIWGARFARNLRDKKSIPFIYTGHGGIGKEEKLIAKQNPDKYITLSEESKTWASQFSKNVTQIDTGVSLQKFSKEFVIKQIDKDLQHPIILCNGAFTQFKRQKLLIDAIAELEEGTVIFLGSGGELEQEIKDYAQAEIPGRYQVKSVPYVDVPYYFQLCDVFSLPSYNEPFGIVYLEALAANKPIVAPEDQVRSHIVGDCGILCDVTNPKEYAKALKSAFKTDWKDKPRKRAESLFSWESIGKKYNDLIKSLVQ